MTLNERLGPDGFAALEPTTDIAASLAHSGTTSPVSLSFGPGYDQGPLT